MKPDWLKQKFVSTEESKRVRKLLRKFQLHTVCEEAACPNRNHCYSLGRATFLILGDVCTRNCRFCAIKKGNPLPPDPDEPANIARAVELLGIRYAVITSVTRDDLPDYGAEQFIETVQEIRKLPQAVSIELLTPDFMGNKDILKSLFAEDFDVFNHNVETVPRLYKTVRPQADYRRSLDVLSFAARNFPDIITKSGIMVGLGETKKEVKKTILDLATSGVKILTIGQYLRPSERHLPVAEYIHPELFEEYREFGESAGITYVYSAPLVRSSFSAEEVFLETKQTYSRKEH